MTKTGRGLLVMSFLSSLFGTSKVIPGWQRTNAVLGTLFQSNCILPTSAAEALIGGSQRNGTTFRDQYARIYRFTDGKITQQYEGAGGIYSLSRQGNIVWALRMKLRETKNGCYVYPLRSIDGGLTWNQAGEVIFSPLHQGVSSIAAVSEKEAWIHGSYLLRRSVDGGKTWNEISTPWETEHNPYDEVLRVEGNSVFLVGKAGVHETTDGGQHWYRYDVAGAEVYDLVDHLIVARHEGQVRLGEITRNRPISWRQGGLERDLLIHQLRASGESVAIWGTPNDDQSAILPTLCQKP